MTSTALVLVDERAEALPLLSLAEDLAARQGKGTLMVAVRAFPSSERNGAIVWPDRRGTVILIDPEGVQRLGTTVEGAFAHELAHLLEPERWPTAQRERFANTLGPMLLAHSPTSYEEAGALVAASLVRLAAAPPGDVACPQTLALGGA